MKSSASAPSLTQTTLLASPFFLRTRMHNSASVGLSSINSMSTTRCESGMVFVLSWKRERKTGALVERTLRPDATLVTHNDALDYREADPGTRIISLTLQALEDAEKLAHIFHVESDAVVFDIVSGLGGLELGADFDRRRCAALRKLDGVVEQVDPDAPQHCCVAVGRRQRSHVERNAPAFESRLQLYKCLIDELAHVDIRPDQLLATDTREG